MSTEIASVEGQICTKAEKAQVVKKWRRRPSLRAVLTIIQTASIFGSNSSAQKVSGSIGIISMVEAPLKW